MICNGMLTSSFRKQLQKATCKLRGCAAFCCIRSWGHFRWERSMWLLWQRFGGVKLVCLLDRGLGYVGIIFRCFSLFINLKSAHVSGRQPAPELACIATGSTFSCCGIATFAVHDFAANECWFNCNYWQCVLTNHKAFARSSTEAHPTKTPQKSAFSVLLYYCILSKFCVDKMFLKVHFAWFACRRQAPLYDLHWDAMGGSRGRMT